MAAEKRQLTAALVGAGGIARSLHIPAHRQAEGSALKWVCSSHLPDAEQFALQYTIPRWTDKLEEVLADPQVDWVDIATPNSTHEQIAVQCLRAGKHVLCQKPMTAGLDSAKRMVEEAERAGRQLGVYMCFRGDPALQLLKRCADAGRFGRIISYRGRMISSNGYRLQEGDWRMAEQAGSLELLGVHLIDLFLWFHGNIRSVQAYSNTLYASMTGDDVTTAIYGFADGVSAVMETTYSSYVGPDTPMYVFEVNGTEGWASYRMEQGGLRIQLAEGYDDVSDRSGIQLEANRITELQFSTYKDSIDVHQAFINAVAEGRPFGIDGRTGLEHIKVMERTLQAAKAGQRLDIG
jgi:predicted dehydrogenase